MGFREAPTAEHDGRVTTTRADAVRGRLTALASAGLDVGTFALAAVDLLARAVPFESACFGTADPETSLMTGSYKRNLPDPKDAKNISGAACYEVNGERKSCLLAGDEARHACFFRIDGQTIVPGPSIKLFPHKENNVAMSEADIEGVSFRTAITT